MKRIFIFTFLMLFAYNLCAQNADRLYTKEAVKELLQEGDISGKWQKIFLDTAEDIDKANLAKIVRQSINRRDMRRQPKTPNEFVLYKSLLLLTSLYSYRPVINILDYNTTPGQEDFKRASKKLKNFYTIMGTLSLHLIDWNHLFPAETKKKIRANNTYINLQDYSHPIGDKFYSTILRMLEDQANEGSPFLQTIPETKSELRAWSRKIENIITKHNKQLIKKYPDSVLPHLLYAKLLKDVQKIIGTTYIRYNDPEDLADYQRVVRIMQNEIEKAYKIQEIPLVLYYYSDFMPEKRQLYERWLELDPGNLLAQGNLISQLMDEGDFVEAEERLQVAKIYVESIPDYLKEGSGAYPAFIGYMEMVMAYYKKDYQRLGNITKQVTDISLDYPEILKKIAGMFSNFSIIRDVGKEAYVHSLMFPAIKASDRVIELLPEEELGIEDCYNKAFYDYLTLDDKSTAYNWLVKAVERKVQITENQLARMKFLYARLDGRYAPPGGVPKEIDEYLRID